MLSGKKSRLNLLSIASAASLAFMSVVLPSTKTSAETFTDPMPLVKLDAMQTLALFGQSLQADYYNGVSVDSVSFTYVGTLSEIFNANYVHPDGLYQENSLRGWNENNFYFGQFWDSSAVNNTDWLVYTCPISDFFQPIGTTVDFVVHVPLSIELVGLEQFAFSASISYTRQNYVEQPLQNNYRPSIVISGTDTESGAFEYDFNSMAGDWFGQPQILPQAATVPLVMSESSPVPYSFYFDEVNQNYGSPDYYRPVPYTNTLYCIFGGGHMLRANDNANMGYNVFNLSALDVDFRLGNSVTLFNTVGLEYTNGEIQETSTGDPTPLQCWIFLSCPYIGGEWSIPESDKTTNDIYDIIEQNGITIANIDNKLISIDSKLGIIINILNGIAQNMPSGGGGSGFNPELDLDTASTLPPLSIQAAQSTAESAAVGAGAAVASLGSSAAAGASFGSGLLSRILDVLGFGWCIPAFSAAAIAAWFIYRGRGS